MKVMIAVTHLLGTGHLSRALALGRGFVKNGASVSIVSGGLGVPHLNSEGMDLIQLPPLKVLGGDFSNLLDQNNNPRDDTLTQARITAQIAALHRIKPDVLITELFPLGRRSLRHEYLELLKAAKAQPNPPLILASVRDILAAPSKPERAAQSIAWLKELYNGVLVHAAPAFISLEQSWPVTPDMAPMLHYTGFVASPLPDAAPDGDGHDEILVTAGGGAVGDALFETALHTAQKMPAQRWRFLVGGDTKETRIATLKSRAGETVTVEPTRPDFREMLQRAKLLVAQCGYNTALDVLAAEKPAVFIPYEEGGETEQLIRAEALLRIGPYTVIRENTLTPDTLHLAATQALSSRHRPNRQDLSLDGANQTTRITAKLLAEHRP